MSFESLLFERRDGVAQVTLNRPERLNALDARLIRELTEAASLIAADGGLRAVVLTGSGRAFCSGADLLPGGVLEGADTDPGAAVCRSLGEHFNPMVSAWFHLPLPVVVAVNGIAAGAGASLALVGDLVIAAHSASFLQLFAPKLGLMPDLGGTFHLPRLVGSARAKGLALLGEPLSATDAVAWGLIWAAVADEHLPAEAGKLAQRLAAGPTQAYRRIKDLFNQQPPRTLDEQLALEMSAQGRLAGTADFAEGLAAFRGKRAPRFTGN
jgi:2-(1,2-epoxy-1,2-dihydrophenyl)acetyl-CoA isomerase